jgi:hypothetical protein
MTIMAGMANQTWYRMLLVEIGTGTWTLPEVIASRLTRSWSEADRNPALYPCNDIDNTIHPYQVNDIGGRI